MHSVVRKGLQSSRFSTNFTDTLYRGNAVKIEHCQMIVSLFYKSLVTEDVLMFTTRRTFVS